MTDVESRVSALEVWRQSQSDDIREIRDGMRRVESNVGRLLDRDAERRGRASMFRGLVAAVWLSIGSGLVAVILYALHVGVQH